MPRKKASARTTPRDVDFPDMGIICDQFLVSYGSTGCANRLTPPSQCQRSCEDERTRVRALIFEADISVVRMSLVGCDRSVVEPIGIEPTT